MNKKNKKISLKGETVRNLTLTDTQLGKVHGGSLCGPGEVSGCAPGSMLQAANCPHQTVNCGPSVQNSPEC